MSTIAPLQRQLDAYKRSSQMLGPNERADCRLRREREIARSENLRGTARESQDLAAQLRESDG